MVQKEPPPVVEWWDAPLLVNKTYDDLDQSPVNPDELSQLVTLYVHHPIPIKPPQEQNRAPVLRSLMLTKKEQKKLRRQRRQEAQKEKQDKIRLGLLPPDPPKGIEEEDTKKKMGAVNPELDDSCTFSSICS